MVELSDIQALLDEVEVERKKGHTEVDAKADASIAAIKVVQAMLERRAHVGDRNGDVPVNRVTVPTAPAAPKEWPGPRQAVRNAIPPTRFTLDDIMNSLRATYPGREFQRVNVSGELYALKKMGEISIVEKGRGNIPNQFMKGGPTWDAA